MLALYWLYFFLQDVWHCLLFFLCWIILFYILEILNVMLWLGIVKIIWWMGTFCLLAVSYRPLVSRFTFCVACDSNLSFDFKVLKCYSHPFCVSNSQESKWHLGGHLHCISILKGFALLFYIISSPPQIRNESRTLNKQGFKGSLYPALSSL